MNYWELERRGRMEEVEMQDCPRNLERSQYITQFRRYQQQLELNFKQFTAVNLMQLYQTSVTDAKQTKSKSFLE
jgi:hypothetical protein